MDCTQILETTNDLTDSLAYTQKVEVARLKVNDDHYPIFSGSNRIGRDPEFCSVVFNNMTLSKEHAVIEVDDRYSHLIYDLGSKNKTKLGKMHLKPHVRYQLPDKSQIQFGDLVAEYSMLSDNVEDSSEVIILESDDEVVPETPAQARAISTASSSSKSTSPTIFEMETQCFGSEESSYKREDSKNKLLTNPCESAHSSERNDFSQKNNKCDSDTIGTSGMDDSNVSVIDSSQKKTTDICQNLQNIRIPDSSDGEETDPEDLFVALTQKHGDANISQSIQISLKDDTVETGKKEDEHNKAADGNPVSGSLISSASMHGTEPQVIAKNDESLKCLKYDQTKVIDKENSICDKRQGNRENYGDKSSNDVNGNDSTAFETSEDIKQQKSNVDSEKLESSCKENLEDSAEDIFDVATQIIPSNSEGKSEDKPNWKKVPHFVVGVEVQSAGVGGMSSASVDQDTVSPEKADENEKQCHHEVNVDSDSIFDAPTQVISSTCRKINKSSENAHEEKLSGANSTSCNSDAAQKFVCDTSNSSGPTNSSKTCASETQNAQVDVPAKGMKHASNRTNNLLSGLKDVDDSIFEAATQVLPTSKKVCISPSNGDEMNKPKDSCNIMLDIRKSNAECLLKRDHSETNSNNVSMIRDSEKQVYEEKSKNNLLVQGSSCSINININDSIFEAPTQVISPPHQDKTKSKGSEIVEHILSVDNKFPKPSSLKVLQNSTVNEIRDEPHNDSDKNRVPIKQSKHTSVSSKSSVVDIDSMDDSFFSAPTQIICAQRNDKNVLGECSTKNDEVLPGDSVNNTSNSSSVSESADVARGPLENQDKTEINIKERNSDVDLVNCCNEVTDDESIFEAATQIIKPKAGKENSHPVISNYCRESDQGEKTPISRSSSYSSINEAATQPIDEIDAVSSPIQGQRENCTEDPGRKSSKANDNMKERKSDESSDKSLALHGSSDDARESLLDEGEKTPLSRSSSYGSIHEAATQPIDEIDAFSSPIQGHRENCTEGPGRKSSSKANDNTKAKANDNMKEKISEESSEKSITLPGPSGDAGGSISNAGFSQCVDLVLPSTQELGIAGQEFYGNSSNTERKVMFDSSSSPVLHRRTRTSLKRKGIFETERLTSKKKKSVPFSEDTDSTSLNSSEMEDLHCNKKQEKIPRKKSIQNKLKKEIPGPSSRSKRQELTPTKNIGKGRRNNTNKNTRVTRSKEETDIDMNDSSEAGRPSRLRKMTWKAKENSEDNSGKQTKNKRGTTCEEESTSKNTPKLKVKFKNFDSTEVAAGESKSTNLDGTKRGRKLLIKELKETIIHEENNVQINTVKKDTSEIRNENISICNESGKTEKNSKKQNSSSHNLTSSATNSGSPASELNVSPVIQRKSRYSSRKSRSDCRKSDSSLSKSNSSDENFTSDVRKMSEENDAEEKFRNEKDNDSHFQSEEKGESRQIELVATPSRTRKRQPPKRREIDILEENPVPIREGRKHSVGKSETQVADEQSIPHTSHKLVSKSRKSLLHNENTKISAVEELTFSSKEDASKSDTNLPSKRKSRRSKTSSVSASVSVSVSLSDEKVPASSSDQLIEISHKRSKRTSKINTSSISDTDSKSAVNLPTERRRGATKTLELDEKLSPVKENEQKETSGKRPKRTLKPKTSDLNVNKKPGKNSILPGNKEGTISSPVEKVDDRQTKTTDVHPLRGRLMARRKDKAPSPKIIDFGGDTPPHGAKGRKRKCDSQSSSQERSSQSSQESTPKRSSRINQKLSYFIMFTGVVCSDADETAIKKLGGKIVQQLEECTVLVTDKVRRTYKFLCILAQGKPIVSVDWIKKSQLSGHFLDPWDFIVKDKESEKRFKFQLLQSLKVACTTKLLDGYSVFSTPSVKPPPSEMKGIVENSGGLFLSKEPRNGAWPERCFIISTDEDRKLCSKLKKSSVPIVKAEIILSGILQQKLCVDDHILKC